MYADASWANKTSCWSISRYVWCYASGLILHVLKKQATVTLSSTEVEYMAVTHVIQEGLWLHSLFNELKIPFQFPVPIYLNNSGTIALSVATKFHQCTKHINICYHFICSHKMMVLCLLSGFHHTLTSQMFLQKHCLVPLLTNFTFLLHLLLSEGVC